MSSPAVSAQICPELVDRLIDLYCDWRTECAEVLAAYRRFTAAPAGDRALAYAVYGAALDREESAAEEYARHLMLVAHVAPAVDDALERPR
jgi:hypothetical protein